MRLQRLAGSDRVGHLDILLEAIVPKVDAAADDAKGSAAVARRGVLLGEHLGAVVVHVVEAGEDVDGGREVLCALAGARGLPMDGGLPRSERARLVRRHADLVADLYGRITDDHHACVVGPWRVHLARGACRQRWVRARMRHGEGEHSHPRRGGEGERQLRPKASE